MLPDMKHKLNGLAVSAIGRVTGNGGNGGGGGSEGGGGRTEGSMDCDM